MFFPLIDTENPTIIAAAIFVGLIFTTLMYAPQAAMFSELFGTSVRYSGASLGYQLASVFAGGWRPLSPCPCWAPLRKKTPWPSASTSRSWP